MKKYILVSSVLLSSFTASAEEMKTISTMDTIVPSALIGLGVLIVLLIFAIISLGNYVYLEYKKTDSKPPAMIGLFGIFHSDVDFMAGNPTDTVIHDYDGIQEYDNDMPPWWIKGFYGTIVFAVVYFSYYHVFELGELQGEAFETEMAIAKEQFNSVDLVYEAPTEDEQLLTEASEAFQKTCKSCHGANAQGLAGPNLTDKYWIYGGDVNTLYETIKFGRKGEGLMPAQGTRFSNEQIYALSSYIMSLQGSNPENPLPRKDTENIVYPEEK